MNEWTGNEKHESMFYKNHQIFMSKNQFVFSMSKGIFML